MYKVLYIVSTLQNSGPTNQLFYIIDNIDKSIYNPEIITLSPEPLNSLKSKFVDLGVPIHSLNFSRFRGIFSAKKELNHIIKRIKPDLIHTQGIRSDQLINRLKLTVPTLLTIRNYPLDDYKKEFGLLFGSLMAKNHIRVLKRTKNVIACSEELSKKFRLLNGFQTDFIQNGVDQNYYKKAAKEQKNIIRNELNINTNAKVFIHSGSLIKRKNVSTIIDSFNRLDSKYNVVLIVLGDGSEEKLLKMKAISNGRISFLGSRPNILKYYQCSDYIISASTSEGLPNAILEAMSCALPALLSDIDPHKEIFRSVDNYPYFFNPNDTDRLTNLVIKLSEMNDTDLSNQMRQIIESNFTAQIMSGKYQNLYSKLISNGSKF